jgi:SHS2 domain-containing protein
VSTTGTAAHRFVEHTGELELSVEAPTEAGVFEEALAAFRTLVGGDGGSGTPARHELDLAAADRALLLVAWLDELVFLAEVEDFLPDRVVDLVLEDDRLRAAVEGRRGRPPHLVKAVTLNDLEWRQEGGSWHARVVLDV